MQLWHTFTLNTIKKYLTPNCLLFGRQLLCYSNTTSTVVRNLTVPASTTDKISCIRYHFWHSCRHEYVVNLCETQRASKIKYKLLKNYVVLVYDEKMSRHFWRIGIVTRVLPSRDSETKRSDGRIEKHNATLKHLVNKLFPTEYTYHDTKQTDKAREQKLTREAAVIGELKRKHDC